MSHRSKTKANTVGGYNVRCSGATPASPGGHAGPLACSFRGFRVTQSQSRAEESACPRCGGHVMATSYGERTR